jgi:hypothetical protein
MEWFTRTLLVPLKLLSVITRIGSYHYDRLLRKNRFALKQSHSVLIELANILSGIKFDKHDKQQELEWILDAEKHNLSSMKKELNTLKEKYGFSDAKKAYDQYLNNFFDNSLKNDGLGDLAKKVIELKKLKIQFDREHPEKKSVLNANLVELERIREMTEFTIINLCNYTKRGDIKRTTDIVKMFDVTKSNELLTYNNFSIKKCGVDSYFL